MKGVRMVTAILVGLLALFAGAVFYGERSWEAQTARLNERLSGSATGIFPEKYHQEELEGLPEPVQRYFMKTLSEGQPMVKTVHMNHSGSFNMGSEKENWRPFISEQIISTNPPGFDWHARIRIAPFLNVKVHDAYVEGEGILHASLFGIVTLAEMRGTPDIAEGELMRFLAEASWYPSALLPSQGVSWESLDESTALATIKDRGIRLRMLFRFGRDGLIESVRSESRGRMVSGRSIPTPWEGRWLKYEMRSGMLVPSEGEVGWIIDGVYKPYWRGRVTDISYVLEN